MGQPWRWWPRILDPIAWAVLLVVFVGLGWDIRWMLLIVPLWIGVRIGLKVRRAKDEGLW